MIIKKIHLENFGLFINQTLECENIKLASILGSYDSNPRKSNGSGKSTLMSAVLYALFDKAGKLKDSDLRTRGSTGHMLVEFHFKMNNNNYMIRRGRSAKDSPILEFQINNDPIIKGNKRDVQERIEQAISLDHDLLVISNFFRQDNSDIFTDADPSVRKEHFQKLLQLEIYDVACEKAKKKAKSYRETTENLKNLIEFTKRSDISILDTDNDLEKLDLQIKQGIKDLEQLNLDCQKLIKDKENYSDYQNKILLSQNKVSLLMQNISQYKDQINSIGSTDIFEYENTLSSLKFFIIKDIVSLKNQELDLQNKLTEYRVNKTNLTKSLNDFKTMKGECPTCFQVLPEGLKEIKIEELTSEIQNIEQLFEKTNNDLISLQRIISIEEEHLIHNNKTEETKKSLEQGIVIRKENLEKKLDLENKLASFESQIKNEEAALENEKKKLPTNTEEINKIIFETQEIIQATTKQLQDIKLERELVNERLKRKKELQKSLNELNADLKTKESQCLIYDMLVDIFGKNGIPALIIDNTLSLIQNKANEYLKAIDPTKTIIFQTIKETQKGELKESLDLLIEDRSFSTSNNIGPYKTCSGGEKDIIDFCLHMAFSNLIKSRSGTNVEFVFLDEIFGSLDDFNTDQLVSILNIIQKEFSQIFVISHTSLKEIFPDRIKIIKTEYGSKILYD